MNSSAVAEALRRTEQGPIRSRSIEGIGGPASGSGVPSRSDLAARISTLEQKNQEQERFNSYLMEQLNKFESKIGRTYSRGASRSNVDYERLENLEADLRKQEKDHQELQQRIRQVFNNYKYVDSTMKGMQRQEDTELSQIRNMFQDKFTQDQKLHDKHKEKSKVLFGELVRIGEQQDKSKEFLQSLSVSLENRLATLENRLNQGERQVVSLDSRSDNGLQMLMSLAEKVEKRVQSIEEGLYNLNNEHQKGQKNVERVEVGTNYLREDIQNFLKQLQGDLQHRVELKTSSILNKLLQEQEERLRNHDDLKYTFETKDKLINEKIEYEKQELKDRIATLESFIKTELQRNEELINNLQNLLDGQLRVVYETIRGEESTRVSSDSDLKEEINQVSDNTRQVFEQFKSYQSGITDKIKEMIQTEIDVRSKAEKDMRYSVSSNIKHIFKEIEILKDSVEQSKYKAEYDLKQAQTSFSEKADLLSRYIEEEVKRVSEIVRNQYNQTKEMITTLTDSLKQNIINNEKYKSDSNKKFIKVEQILTKFKHEFSKGDTNTETKIFTKIKQLQAYLESHLASNSQVLEERIDSLASTLESSLSSFEKSLQYNRQTFSEIINKLNEEIEEQHLNTCEDLQKLLKGIERIEEEMDSVQDEVQEKVMNIGKQVALVESQAAVDINTEKFMREHLINRFSQDFEEQLKEIEEKTKAVEERLDEEEKIQQGNDDRNLEKFEEISEEMASVTDSIKGLKFELETNSESKEHFEYLVQSYLCLQDVVSQVEAKQLLETLSFTQENQKTKNQEIKGTLNLVQQELENMQKTYKESLQENQYKVIEIVDQKITEWKKLEKESQEPTIPSELPEPNRKGPPS